MKKRLKRTKRQSFAFALEIGAVFPPGNFLRFKEAYISTTKKPLYFKQSVLYKRNSDSKVSLKPFYCYLARRSET